MRNQNNQFTHYSGLAIAVLGIAFFMSSCVIVNPGEVGIKTRLGKIQGEPRPEGPVGFNPMFSQVFTVPVRTVELTLLLDAPTKEGLTVKTEVTLLYRVKAVEAKNIFINFGRDYERVVVLPNFRSTVRDISARFQAEDFYTASREQIELAVADELRKRIEKHGFIIENTLLKSIQLPARLQDAIENKLRSEQEAQQMQFILQRESLEADRKRIEAEGIRDFQSILTQGLNDNVIRWYSLEAFRELSNSPNAKIIVTDGKTPMLISPELPTAQPQPRPNNASAPTDSFQRRNARNINP